MESDLPHIVNLINSVIGVGILERVFRSQNSKIRLETRKPHSKGYAILHVPMWSSSRPNGAVLLWSDDSGIVCDVDQIGKIKKQKNLRVPRPGLLWLGWKICN